MRTVLLSFLFPALLFPLTVLAEPGNKISIQTEEISRFLPTEPQRKTFGKLEFLGGLILTSEDQDFGGLSGIRMLEDNRFITISDQGKWFTGEVVREGDKPVAITGARTDHLRDSEGEKIKGKRNADSEGIELDVAEFLISFERNDRVERFAFDEGKLVAKSRKPEIDFNDTDLPYNKGPEGLALAPPASPIAGSLLVLPELAINAEDNTRIFLVTNGERKELAIKGVNGFGITDATFMQNGDLLVLERKYSFFSGLGIQLVKYDAETIAEGSVLEGELLLSVSGDHEIDNMEGITISPMPDGSTRITLISDDNFSGDQRTLLLEFQYQQ